MKKYILVLFLGACILNAEILEIKQLFNKKLVKVQKEQIGPLKSFYGRLTFDESLTFDVVSRFDGYITKLDANKLYSMAKKNEPLFSIYSDEVSSIIQEINIAKKFNKSLVKSNINKLKALAVDNKEIKRIVKGKEEISEIAFYSPYDSLVIKKEINNGSFVKKGSLLLQLASLEKLWVIASVYQKDLSFINKGLKAKVYIDGFDEPVVSTVDYIYPTVDETNKSVDVRLVIDNKDLKYSPNMFAKVDIKQNNKEILTLPKTAVLQKGSKHYVFQYLSESEYEPIEVTAKRISSKKYEIIDGIQEGQSVINNALFLLDSDAITNGLYSSDDDDW
ncbi:cation transporter [Arcobacter sp. CECT 8983]|uniref:efflux RND transporter periplasmic adaptor subunit n=1 Tax=Arcobacter sp. CECT 8983 TaxID=2044508 RepID=UPI00100C0494|nr:efflux RND transporter periplasmic adaptor subunit [Arcobacter sp. CECT 8983]RXJ91664.1 cation transporter [Arcobacter sp. CECT 8983]